MIQQRVRKKKRLVSILDFSAVSQISQESWPKVTGQNQSFCSYKIVLIEKERIRSR